MALMSVDDAFTMTTNATLALTTHEEGDFGQTVAAAVADERRGFVSAEAYALFKKYYPMPSLVICVLGTVANFFNLRAFYRLGLTDSVTILFFFLAVMDFSHLFFGIAHAMSAFVETYQKETGAWFKLMPHTVKILILQTMRLFSDIAFFITAFLAVQRCLCVIKPLHFKNIFTPARTYYSLVPIILFPTPFPIALLMHMDMKTIFNPSYNATQYYLALGPAAFKVLDFIFILTNIVFNTTIQLIMAVCLFVIGRTLVKSLRFRQTTTSSGSNANANADSNSKTADGNHGNQASLLKNSKERKVIIQVSAVCLIFLTCYTPRIFYAFTSLLMPEFMTFRRYHNASNIFMMMSGVLEQINSSVNFFVYYKYNSRFKSVCFNAKPKHK